VRFPIRSVAIAAVVCGVLAAAVVALVVPTRSEGERARPVKRAIVMLPARAQKLQRGMLYFAPERGSVHIEAKLADPRGGPPFALRLFRARRLALAGSPVSLEHSRLLGHDLCAQLGRLYRGRFGWLDARSRFRPIGFSYRDAPIACGDRWRDARSEPQLRLTTLITDPERTTATATTSVAWGFAGARARSVELKGFAKKTPAVSGRGAFLGLHGARADISGELMRAALAERLLLTPCLTAPAVLRFTPSAFLADSDLDFVEAALYRAARVATAETA